MRERMSLAGDVVPVGDAAVMGVVGDSAGEAASERVWALYNAALKTFARGALDVVPAYGSVLVRFDPSSVQMAVAMAAMRGALEQATLTEAAPARQVEIGVSFDPEHAPDLPDVARSTGLEISEIIAEFCRPDYRVAFLGFSAGFPYLLGLSSKLDLPRLPAPRVKVPAGSVAFAAGQCGIYPRSSPGGWRIIGRTSASLFDPTRTEPALLHPGDRVRFHAAQTLAQAGAIIS